MSGHIFSSGGRAARTRTAAGITFLEIMVVITILGVLAAISTPSLRNMYQKQQLSSSARQIGALFRYARAAAVMNEGEVKVMFDVNSARYRLKLPPREEDEDRRSNTRYRDLERRKSKTVEEPRYLPPDVEFVQILTDAPEEKDAKNWATGAIFYQNGAASPCFVILENKRGRKITIEVQHSTGAVKIYTGEPAFEEPEPADDSYYYTRRD